ncbi:MAG: NarK/NasA family nitrate transporter [Candidatus Nitronauta litoralis]|uniref:NarK/NasA family nitrate transporter n=1 Tax=Candidatus Nitronauta litoralis TaxID=2705533 RepID=A0A7T0BW02_9BACT|nr:MAG: NarK/NasA family nitrate transporter [Candidatus Nitronauta litoralis]
MPGFNQSQQAILHLSWIAFFLTFVSWFNFAPFNTTLASTMFLDEGQIRVLMIANVALTIPARIVIGSLVDALGPKRVFVSILIYSGAVSFMFALAQDFNDLLIARLLMGVAGAGFVVGIKMIAEWFPRESMGFAQGIYAGWGNFGAAAAVFGLPLIASFFAPEMGWRIASFLTGAACLLWAFGYFLLARDKEGPRNGFRLGMEQAIEVSSKGDLFLQIIMLVPVYTALGFLVFKLTIPPAVWLTPSQFWSILFVFSGLFAWNAVTCVRSNLDNLASPSQPERDYAFKQILILSLVYALTFGSELAVISMFPEFLENTFAFSVTTAGVLGSCFAAFNLITRPCGGLLADKLGRRRVLFFLVANAGICYWLMSYITSAWPVNVALGLAVVCSILIQTGNGACFSMVPLIRRDLTGQLAGLAGAYGNVGAVLFLTVLTFVDASTFFFFISGFAAFVTICIVFLDSFDKPHSSFNNKRGA